MQSNQLPHGASVSLSKQVTNCHLMPDGRVPGNKNVPDRPMAANFPRIAQNSENSSAFNQNSYRGAATNRSLSSNVPDLSSSALSNNLPIGNRDGPQVLFPGVAQTPSPIPKTASQQPTSAASYFNNLPPKSSGSFPTSATVPPKVSV